MGSATGQHADVDHGVTDDSTSKKKVSNRLKGLIVALELLFVGGLLVVWLLSESVQHSKSLWILFFYSFPSEFLVAPVPHEPIFFYFGKFYPAWLVAAVAVSSTVLTEALNYSIFQYFSDQKFFDRVRHSGLTKKLVDLFYKAPFVALVIGGLSPVPFYPLRFLVVLARYPLHRYLLAVLVSRAPRFYVLALLGRAVEVPNWLLVALFVVLVLAINVPLVVKMAKKTPEEPQ